LTESCFLFFSPSICDYHQLRRKKSPKTVKDQAKIGAVAAPGSSSGGQNSRSTDEMTESEDSDDDKKQTAKAKNGTSIEDRMNAIEGKVAAFEPKMNAIEGKVDALMTMVSKLVNQKDA